MHIVIYKFEVIQGREPQFREAWAKLTQAFLDHAMSLGSRLHKDENGVFIAYAQWPDEETFLKSKDKLPLYSNRLISQMEASCASIAILHKLNVEMDLLISG